MRSNWKASEDSILRQLAFARWRQDAGLARGTPLEMAHGHLYLACLQARKARSEISGCVPRSTTASEQAVAQPQQSRRSRSCSSTGETEFVGTFPTSHRGY